MNIPLNSAPVDLVPSQWHVDGRTNRVVCGLGLSRFRLGKPISIFGLVSMTTFISGSHVLAIPYFALAPQLLDASSHLVSSRFRDHLLGAATLFQAHLIQPGRALGAEPQVRSSFQESLQLHL